jgi:hypothetical protein
MYNDYNIKYATINLILCKIKESQPKNIISVYLHPEAIIHKYNGIYKEFNDSFIFLDLNLQEYLRKILKY